MIAFIMNTTYEYHGNYLNKRHSSWIVLY